MVHYQKPPATATRYTYSATPTFTVSQMKPPIFNASALEIYRVLADVKSKVTIETVVTSILISTDKNAETGENTYFLTLSVCDPNPVLRDQEYIFVGSLTTTNRELVDILGGQGERLDYYNTLLNLAADPAVRRAKLGLLAA